MRSLPIRTTLLRQPRDLQGCWRSVCIGGWSDWLKAGSDGTLHSWSMDWCTALGIDRWSWDLADGTRFASNIMFDLVVLVAPHLMISWFVLSILKFVASGLNCLASPGGPDIGDDFKLHEHLRCRPLFMSIFRYPSRLWRRHNELPLSDSLGRCNVGHHYQSWSCVRANEWRCWFGWSLLKTGYTSHQRLGWFQLLHRITWFSLSFC